MKIIAQLAISLTILFVTSIYAQDADNLLTLKNNYNKDLTIVLSGDTSVLNMPESLVLHPGDSISSPIVNEGEVYLEANTLVDPIRSNHYTDAYFAVANYHGVSQLHCYLGSNLDYTCPQQGPKVVVFSQKN